MGIKKQIGMALATTALGAMLIGGGTFALFTDEVNNTGNTFTTGTISIDAGNVAVFSGAVYGNLAPGDSGSSTLTVTNTGSLDAFVKINGITSQSGGLFEGSKPLEITWETDEKLIAAGDSATFTVYYSLPLDAGNEYQGQTGTFDIVVKAVQAKNNDSDNDGKADSWD